MQRNNIRGEKGDINENQKITVQNTELDQSESIIQQSNIFFQPRNDNQQSNNFINHQQHISSNNINQNESGHEAIRINNLPQNQLLQSSNLFFDQYSQKLNLQNLFTEPVKINTEISQYANKIYTESLIQPSTSFQFEAFTDLKLNSIPGIEVESFPHPNINKSYISLFNDNAHNVPTISNIQNSLSQNNQIQTQEISLPKKSYQSLPKIINFSQPFGQDFSRTTLTSHSSHPINYKESIRLQKPCQPSFSQPKIISSSLIVSESFDQVFSATSTIANSTLYSRKRINNRSLISKASRPLDKNSSFHHLPHTDSGSNITLKKNLSNISQFNNNNFKTAGSISYISDIMKNEKNQNAYGLFPTEYNRRVKMMPNVKPINNSKLISLGFFNIQSVENFSKEKMIEKSILKSKSPEMFISKNRIIENLRNESIEPQHQFLASTLSDPNKLKPQAKVVLGLQNIACTAA